MTVSTDVSTSVFMSDEDPIKKFREASDPGGKSAAGRSAADDVIEQVGQLGPARPTRPPGSCPQCSSMEIRTTRPIGSAARNLCRSCGFKWLGGPKSPAPLILEKNGPTQTITKGPYYSGSAVLPDRDPHEPTARRKGKSLSALREKDK